MTVLWFLLIFCMLISVCYWLMFVLMLVSMIIRHLTNCVCLFIADCKWRRQKRKRNKKREIRMANDYFPLHPKK